jgi:myosin heavy chain 9/10/11/14
MNGSPKRANPFGRQSASPSPRPQAAPLRPKSAVFSSPSGLDMKGHARNSSLSQLSAINLTSPSYRDRSGSLRHNVEVSGTFAPQFIKSEELRRGGDHFEGIEGDTDFSGKRYVWLKDADKAFVRVLVLEEGDDDELLVQLDDGSVRIRGPKLVQIYPDSSHSSNARSMLNTSTRSTQ